MILNGRVPQPERRRPSTHRKMKIDLCCCICRVGPFTRAEVNDIYAPTNSANYGSDQVSRNKTVVFFYFIFV